MVVRAYAAHIRVTLECRWMESWVIGDCWGCADEAYGGRRWSEMVGGMQTRADEVYHDTDAPEPPGA